MDVFPSREMYALITTHLERDAKWKIKQQQREAITEKSEAFSTRPVCRPSNAPNHSEMIIYCICYTSDCHFGSSRTTSGTHCDNHSPATSFVFLSRRLIDSFRRRSTFCHLSSTHPRPETISSFFFRLFNVCFVS